MFEGRPAPLDAKCAAGTLRLVSAQLKQMVDSSGQSAPCPVLEFDATGCPSLLPCQVIGVRLTDSYGNTRFTPGYGFHSGRSISMAVTGAEGSFPLQSLDWKVRVAICRGVGASYAPGETASYVWLLFRDTPGKHTFSIRGRTLTLEGWGRGERGIQIQTTTDIGAPVWPVMAKLVGYDKNGQIVNLCEDDQVPAEALYTVRRVSMIRLKYAFGVPVPAKEPTFDAHLSIPPDIISLDLHMALETPTVFEFLVKAELAK